MVLTVASMIFWLVFVGAMYQVVYWDARSDERKNPRQRRRLNIPTWVLYVIAFAGLFMSVAITKTQNDAAVSDCHARDGVAIYTGGAGGGHTCLEHAKIVLDR